MIECPECKAMIDADTLWPELPELDECDDPRRGRFACVLVDADGHVYGEPLYIMPSCADVE